MEGDNTTSHAPQIKHDGVHDADMLIVAIVLFHEREATVMTRNFQSVLNGTIISYIFLNLSLGGLRNHI